MMDELAGTLTESPLSNTDCGTPSDWDAMERTAPDDTIPFSVTMLGPCNAIGSGRGEPDVHLCLRRVHRRLVMGVRCRRTHHHHGDTRIQRRCASRNRTIRPAYPGPPAELAGSESGELSPPADDRVTGGQ